MTDVGDITRLIHQYAKLVDDADWDAVAALFEHATWHRDATVLRGAAEVRPMYGKSPVYDGRPRAKHLITNLSIEVLPGALEATAECYFTALRAAPNQPIQVTMSGRYIDRFDKVDGAWRFADREFIEDIEYHHRKVEESSG